MTMNDLEPTTIRPPFPPLMFRRPLRENMNDLEQRTWCEELSRELRPDVATEVCRDENSRWTVRLPERIRAHWPSAPSDRAADAKIIAEQNALIAKGRWPQRVR